MPMAAIEAYGITGEQPLHCRGDGCPAGTQQKVDMLCEQCPRIASRLRVLEQIIKPIDEILPVGIVFENRLPFNPTDDNMLQCTRCIYSGFSWHDGGLSN